MQEKTLFEKLDTIEQMIKEQHLFKKEMLTLKEAAAYLSLSPSFIYKKTSTRTLPHYCPNGKILFFKRTELDHWLLRNKVMSIDELN